MLAFKLFLICAFVGVTGKPTTKVNLKLTNANCVSFNKSWAVINECRLRALRRDVNALNINITLLHPANVVKLNIAYMQRANGYKPFVLNTTFDTCAYMAKRNNPIYSLIYSLIKDATNLNHTCPYTGDQILKNFYPRNELMTLPLPQGDYLLLMTWFLHNMKTIATNVYFTWL